jgi:hypothetical protein
LGLRGKKENGESRKLYNEEIQYLFSSLNIIQMIESKKMEWEGPVTSMGGLVRKPKGKRPLGIPKSTREDNIKMDLKERGWNGLECVHSN